MARGAGCCPGAVLGMRYVEVELWQPSLSSRSPWSSPAPQLWVVAPVVLGRSPWLTSRKEVQRRRLFFILQAVVVITRLWCKKGGVRTTNRPWRCIFTGGFPNWTACRNHAFLQEEPPLKIIFLQAVFLTKPPVEIIFLQAVLLRNRL